MLKHLVTAVCCGLIYGCATYSEPTCVGTTALPASLANQFEAVTDPELLAKAIGQENRGMLCEGQVYQAKADAKVVLFRAWNSTNPKSQLGNWWAFDQPMGKVAEYRKDYAICYQWTPLDMLVQCTLKPGTRVVVGTGQSIQCSPYLSYPVSATQQVFVDNAEASTEGCTTFTGVFGWQ